MNENIPEKLKCARCGREIPNSQNLEKRLTTFMDGQGNMHTEMLTICQCPDDYMHAFELPAHCIVEKINIQG